MLVPYDHIKNDHSLKYCPHIKNTFRNKRRLEKLQYSKISLNCNGVNYSVKHDVSPGSYGSIRRGRE